MIDNSEEAEARTDHDWRAIGLDVTDHYTIRDEDKPHVKRIIDVFFYDATEYTYCCEITPSHFLRYLYTFILYAVDCPDDVRDALDNRYCHEGTDDCFMHVHSVQHLTEFVAKYGDKREDKAATEEEVREYWQGNWPI